MEAMLISFRFRLASVAPTSDSGHFWAEASPEVFVQADTELVFLNAPGRGKWVRAVVSFGSLNSSLLEYLGGEKLLYVVHSGRPGLHGTEVEELFGGSFYTAILELCPNLFSWPFTEWPSMTTLPS